MRRILSLPSPSMAVAIVALVVALGGWAVAATTRSSPTIRACANKKNGALRLAAKCRHSERSVSWSRTGPPGATGATGAAGTTGLTGATGPQGPQGPGAISYHTTVESGVGEVPIATTPNGLRVMGLCFPGATNVSNLLETDDESEHFQGSGFVIREGKNFFGVDETEGSIGAGANSPKSSDFDLVARDTRFEKFVHVVAHGTAGKPCEFWGMIIPSS